MNRKMKRLVSGALVSVMCFSTVAQAADFSEKDVAKRAVAFYEGADEEFVKISHPEKPTSTKTTNVTDGLLDYIGNGRVGVPGIDEGAEGQGDRGQCYAWASASYGDWMYVTTQFNPMMATIGLMDSGLGHDYDPAMIEALLNAMFRGEFFVKEEDGGNPGSVLSKINVKTGEIEILMSKEKTGTSVDFRNAVRMGNKLYFCGGVNGVPSIYEIDPENNDKATCVYQDESMKKPDAWPQALKKKLSPTIRGMAVYEDYLVINCVGLDENPYIAISKDPSKGFHKIAFAWEDVKEQKPGELFGYPACHFADSIYGGSIWEIIEFNGDLYVAMCTGTPANSPDGGKTMQSFAIVRGRCDGNPEERDSWTWTPVIGDKEKDNAKYTFGIDPERTRSGACNMMVYKDHLYIGEYNDTEIALMNILFGMDAEFMADNFEQSVNLYRMDKNEDIELVMGDTTKMFPESLSGMGSGFDKCENQYIWKMDTFNDKLYVGTFDESSIIYPIGQFSNGDILHLTPEQWDRQIKYLNELLQKLIKKSDDQEAVAMSLNEDDTDVDIEVVEELVEASKDVPEDMTTLDLPETMSADGGFDISSIGELHQAMIMMEGMLDQKEDWTEEDKLEDKVRFADFYSSLYEFYNEEDTQKKLPDFVKDVYEKILNDETLGKVVHMARCLKYLKNAERGFDMMVSEDGIHFETISRDGLGDVHNQGLRAFAISREEQNPWMCIGTANPYYGTQIWRLQADNLSFEKPEVKPDTKPDEKPEVKPDEKPDTKPEVKPDTKPDTQTDKEVPQTGDTSNLPLMGGMFAAGCAAAAVVLMKRRKNA